MIYQVKDIDKIKPKYGKFDVTIVAGRVGSLHCPKLFEKEHLLKNRSHMYIIEHTEDKKRKCTCVKLRRTIDE